MATYPQFVIHPQATRAPIRAEIDAVAGADRLRDVPLPRPRRARGPSRYRPTIAFPVGPTQVPRSSRQLGASR